MTGLKSVLLLSGGMDSAVCGHLLKAGGHTVEGLFVDYGQASRLAERQAAARIAAHLGFKCQICEAKSSIAFGKGEIVGRNAFLAFYALLVFGNAVDP
jgi:7-cyano-7-deazaguanine synthase